MEFDKLTTEQQRTLLANLVHQLEKDDGTAELAYGMSKADLRVKVNELKAAVAERNEEDPLFISSWPTGIGYANRTVDSGGDYVRLGFLSFRTLKLEVTAQCPKELLPRIQQHASQIQAKDGELYKVSTCGQMVRLGRAGIQDVKSEARKHALILLIGNVEAMEGDDTLKVIFFNLTGRNFVNKPFWREQTHKEYLEFMSVELNLSLQPGINLTVLSSAGEILLEGTIGDIQT